MSQPAAPPAAPSEPWPYQEARKLAARAAGYAPGRPLILESGFGPSGLPHLGTMCEVLRPAYVRHALELIGVARPSRLIVFIDDLDGLRKVPPSVPNGEQIAEHLGRPVSRIADPFGCCASFADHMVGLLDNLLGPAAVEYELLRSSVMYASGAFDEALRMLLCRHQALTDIIAPTLREPNRAGWSPFMPICPACGQVNSTVVSAYHPERDSVEFSCERSFGGARGCGFRGEQSVLGGRAKLQWKVDWALRWHVLKVDYELYGKDLIDSARLSGRILRLLGGEPPLGFAYEFFLEAGGGRVSKSKGTQGVSVEQWQRYAPIEVLKYFLILNPRRARKLFLESIPQYVDEYLGELRTWAAEPSPQPRQKSPLEFVLTPHSSRRFASALSFSMMMNLVAALGSLDRDLIWSYLNRYDPALGADPQTRALAATLVDCAVSFHRDFVEPTKRRWVPAGAEREQVRALADFIRQNPQASAEEFEKYIYDLGRRFYDKPGQIFEPLYRVMLGQERGPRLGPFIRMVTPERIVEILDDALAAASS